LKTCNIINYSSHLCAMSTYVYEKAVTLKTNIKMYGESIELN